MKQKVYAISLLLSFMIVLGHEMIPHHHHDFDMDILTDSHDHSEQLSHHDSHNHHHHDSEKHNHSSSKNSEKKHDHSTPNHHHLTATDDFDFPRIELNKKISINQPLLAIIRSLSINALEAPPERDYIRYANKPFHIKSTFEPGAIGLRAPPSIA